MNQYLSIRTHRIFSFIFIFVLTFPSIVFAKDITQTQDSNNINSRYIDPKYVLVHSSKYWDWYAYQTTWENYSYYFQEQLSFPDEVYEELSQLLGVDLINKVQDKKLYLLVREETGKAFSIDIISEIEKGPGIGIPFDAWLNEYSSEDTWSYELITHETVNVFIGQIINGWPIDWWTDTISPFPYALKIIIENRTGHIDAANKSLENADELVNFFLGLMDVYGDDIYQKMLQRISDDGWLDWGTIKTENPSKLLSEFVAAYLSLAAGVNLTNDLNEVFSSVGITYRLDRKKVKKIWDTEVSLQSYPRNHSKWIRFREGNLGKGENNILIVLGLMIVFFILVLIYYYLRARRYWQ